jgi:hypothetical protein
MDEENVRFYIKVRTALNIQERIIHEELFSVYGDKAASLGPLKDSPNGFVKVEKMLKLK